MGKYILRKTVYGLIISFLLILGYSCEKDTFFKGSNATIRYSTDTVFFDTIFTDIGSTTEWLKIYNPYDQNLNISRIELAGGDESQFRININGIQNYFAENVELRPKDSMFIFVEVTVNPNDVNSPMVVQDSIIFTVNGAVQDVDLVAWGQDVNLLNGEVLRTTTFTNEKPYLIYDFLVLDEDETLTIQPGTKLYFHKDARLFILGTLLVNGTLEEPVILQGDRLEEFYEDIPGQWAGIYLLSGSKNNKINYAEIRNGIIGLQVDTFATVSEPTLEITNTRIENMSGIGIYARGAKIEASNCIIADCGQIGVALTLGGDYGFYHCTIANYFGNIFESRQLPSVYLNNYYIDENDVVRERDLDRAYFGNSIIDGGLLNEIVLDNEYDEGKQVSGAFNYTFDHCLIKVDRSEIDITAENFRDILVNENPRFKDISQGDYSLDTLSVVKDAGDPDIAAMFPLDINEVNRLQDAAPDLGAIERTESAEENQE